MVKRFFCTLLALMLIVTALPAGALAEDDGPRPEGYRDVWLPEGESPSLPTAEGCIWEKTGETKIGNVLLCKLTPHSHLSSCPQDGNGNYLCSCHAAHTETCFETGFPQCPPEHSHSTECGGTILYSCGLTESAGHSHEEGCYSLICGQEAGQGAHSHSTETCAYTRTQNCGVTQEHSHDDSCFEWITLCTPAEGEEHTHTDSCFQKQQVCTTAEHRHSESCDLITFTCETPESAGHVHDDGCQVLSCGLEAGQGAHNHSDAGCTETGISYSCGFAQEHSHGEDCVREQVLICTQPIQAHIIQGCPEDCATPEHTHAEDCFSEVTLHEWMVQSDPNAKVTVPKVTVTVTLENAPLAGAQVTLTDADNNIYTAVTDETGTAIFENLPEGNCIPTLTHQDETYLYSCDATALTVSQEAAAFAIAAKTAKLQCQLTIRRETDRYLNGVKQDNGYRFPGYSEKTKYFVTLTDPQGIAQTPYIASIDQSDEETDDDSITLTVPYGYSYSVSEESGPFESSLTNHSGTVTGEDITVTARSTYHFYTTDLDDSSNTLRDTLCIPVSAVDEGGKLLPGAAMELKSSAGYTVNHTDAGDGSHHFCLSRAGSYYLKETAAPKGYTADSVRYKLSVGRCLLEKEVTARIDGETRTVPAIVEDLYLDEAASTLPQIEEGIYRIVNRMKLVDVRVTLRWRVFGSITKPTSAKVGLYQDGTLLKTATVTADTKWTHTWEDLPGNHKYTVKLLDPPEGFSQRTRETLTNKWVITNSAYTNPKTVDDFQLDFWTNALAVSALLLTGALALLRKKKTTK